MPKGRFPCLVGRALVLAALGAGRAGAEPSEELSAAEEKLAGDSPPNVSTELLDPAGRTRFHLTSRATFSDGEKLFTSSSIWSFEGLIAIRVTEGVALTALLPFGAEVPERASESFFFGNLRVGVAGGGYVRLDPEDNTGGSPRLGWGAGIDVYAPTAPDLDPADCGPRAGCDPAAAVRSIRSYEPELYLPDVMSFRARAHVDYRLGWFMAELELGVTPAFTLESNADFLMLFPWAARVSAKPTELLEPFVESGSSIQVVDRAAGDLSTPVLLTLGLRFHAGSMDPAVFTSIDLDEGRLIFGVDVAGVARDRPRASTEARDSVRGLDF